MDPSNPDGSGAHLPFGVLLAASLSAGGSTVLSIATVWLQLKHYHKPRLQRLVVRILVMSVPSFLVVALFEPNSPNYALPGSQSTQSRRSYLSIRSTSPSSWMPSATSTRFAPFRSRRLLDANRLSRPARLQAFVI